MKKLLCMIFSLLVLLGFSQQIVQAEYFFDDDPGFGNAQNLSINNADDIEINDFISISELSPGFHTFNIRFKDESNDWSAVLTRGFYIEANNGEVIPVNEVEYFFNEDPGFGNGQELSISSADDIEINDFISIAELSPGFHTFNIRFKDENNKWSAALTRGFYMEKNLSTPVAIDYIEYFYDDDPGFGNALSYSDFSATTEFEEIFFSNVSGLSEGNHSFYIRLRDELGSWSQTYSHEFLLLNCDLSISGQIFNQNESPVESGEVVLYQYFDAGVSIAVDTFYLNNGSYEFLQVCPLSHYFVKVIPPNMDDFLPTYYGDSPYWEEASIVSTEQSSLSGINVTVSEFANMEVGTSEVGGHIYQAETRGEPVKNVDIVLEYDVPDEKAAYQAVALDRSDEMGSWQIGNLPNGDFRIKVEIPGLSMDTTYYVSIENENTMIDDLDFYVDFNTGIFIDHTGIEEVALNQSLNIYPNPSSNRNVWIENLSQQVKIENITIYLYSGQAVMDMIPDQQKVQISTQSMSTGFYLVKIQTDKGTFIKKLIIQ